MDAMFIRERRKHFRYETGLPVDLAGPLLPDGRSAATTYDIGSEGLGLTLRYGLSAGLWLDIDITNGSQGKVRRRGRVVWVSRLAADRYRAGIEFAGRKSALN